MFFCEACKEKNNWPGILAYTYGICEMCGDKAACYDVPSKFLPPIPLPKYQDHVHRAHCCQLHGCKYGAEDCVVVKSGGQFSMCDVCTEEIYREGGWEEAHLLNYMFQKGRQAAYTEIVRAAENVQRKIKS